MRAPPGGESLPAQHRPTLLPYVLIGFCFLVGVLTRGVQDSFAVFVPEIQREFAATRADVTSIYGFTMLATGMAGPLAGLALDRLGPRLVALVGLSAAALAGLAAAQAAALWHVYLALPIGLGVALAALGGVFHAAVLGRWFSARLGTALAIAWSANGVGIMIMAPLAELLISAQGWRFAWMVLGLTIAAALPLALLLPWRRIVAGSPEYAARQRLDRAENRHGPRIGEALRDWPFWGFFLCFAATSVAVYCLMPQLIALLTARGFSAAEAAGVLAVTGVLMPIGMVGFNWLADRGGRAFSAIAAYGCTGAGIAALWLVESPADILPLAAFVLLFGSTMGSRGPMISTLATLRYRGAHLGRIYGLITCGMGVGTALGAWLGGWIHDLTQSYDGVFALSLLALLVAAVPLTWEARLRERH